MVERQQEKEEGSLDTDDNWISLLLSSKDPGFCKQDSPSGIPCAGQGREGVTPGLPSEQPR